MVTFRNNNNRRNNSEEEKEISSLMVKDLNLSPIFRTMTIFKEKLVEITIMPQS